MNMPQTEMYFIAHVLPRGEAALIHACKEDMRNRYGAVVALRSPAHITLIPPFRFEAHAESKLFTALETLNQRPVFTLKGAGFSSFPPRTLLAAVKDNDDLKRLHADAVTVFGNFPQVKKETRPFHPHITIANRDITPSQFKEAWELYRNRRFDAGWEVKEISLLRYGQKKWDVIYTSPFLYC